MQNLVMAVCLAASAAAFGDIGYRRVSTSPGFAYDRNSGQFHASGERNAKLKSAAKKGKTELKKSAQEGKGSE